MSDLKTRFFDIQVLTAFFDKFKILLNIINKYTKLNIRVMRKI